MLSRKVFKNFVLTVHCKLPNYHQRWNAARYQRQVTGSK